MKHQVLETFRVKTSQGELELQTGQVITLPEDKAISLIEAGKVRPVSESMLEQYKAFIQWLKTYQMTIEDIKRNDIELYDSILSAVENTDMAFYDENLQGFLEGIHSVKQLYLQVMEKVLNNEK